MKYKYEIIRSARKSTSVSISTENKIVVRCPWGLRVEDVEKFLDGKAEWIEKIVLSNSKRLAVNDDVIEFRQIYVEGKRLNLTFADRNEITGECVYIKKKDDIEKLFIDSFAKRFSERVDELAKLAQLYPNSVSFKGYKGRWGCCDAKNNLIFNFILFMLPKDIQEYVIIHELCHTLCHNHSDAFWRLVEEFVPDYKQKRNDLRNYDFLTTLY